MNHEQIRLENGLETLFIDAPGHSFASTQIWFRAGSALEKYENEGIAHFLEHMFFKGTPTRPGAAIAHEVESYGGELNAFTSFDYTCYYINSPADRLNNSVNILMDMVSNPQFLQEDLLPERDVVFEEFRRSIDNPNQYSFAQIQKSSFTGGYSHQILGREDTIKNFSREQLIDYRKENYNLSNALLIVAGDLKKKDEIIETINSFKMPEGPSSHFEEFRMKDRPTFALHKKDVPMVQVTMTIQAPHFSSEEAASEDLALACLGYGETSPLYREMVLRDTLANSVSASSLFMSKGGVHFIRFSCPENNLEKACNRMVATLKTVIKEGHTKDDIVKLKNQYISSKVYDQESLESLTFNMGHGFAQNGDVHCDSEFIERIRKTSASNVNSSLRSVFSKAIHISSQIPEQANDSKVEKTLKTFHQKLVKLKSKVSQSKTKYKVKKSKYDPQAEVIELKEGLKLVYRQNTLTPTFVMQVYMKGGLTEETNRNNGIYHLLSTNLVKGHKNKKYEQMQRDLEFYSCSMNSFAGKNAYGITTHAQTEHFEIICKDFIGSFLTPLFPAKHIAQERKITERQLLNQQKDPTRICFRKVNETLFESHPYSYNILGSKQKNKSYTRDQIVKLHEKNLKSKEIILTYCGDLTKDEIIPIILEQFESRKYKKPTAKPKVNKAPKPKTGKEYFIEFDREQTQIFIGIPTAPLKSKHNHILKIVTTHLSGQSSELFVEVRDRKGLCYSAQPIQFKALEGGYWGIYMASGHDKVYAAIESIKEILDRIQKNGLTKEEFERVKLMVQGQTQINIQTNEDYASIYSIPTLQGLGLDYHHESLDYIKDLKYEDFQKEIKKIFSKKWNSYIVGRKY